MCIRDRLKAREVKQSEARRFEWGAFKAFAQPAVIGLGLLGALYSLIINGANEIVNPFLQSRFSISTTQAGFLTAVWGLGVVLGLLGGISLLATLIWVACIVGVLLFTGWLASKVVPGKRVPLITELPPMRMPVLGNVLKKTGGRLKWYLIEVIPLLLIGTLIMFSLDRSGALPWIIEAGKPLVVDWLGLPPEASAAFVMGFLRRDFGASGLFALQAELSMVQAVVDDNFGPAFEAHFERLMRAKLGLREGLADDETFIGETFGLLQRHRPDFTLFFRRLSSVRAAASPASSRLSISRRTAIRCRGVRVRLRDGQTGSQ